MKKILTFVFSLLLGAVFLVGLFRYAVGWQELEEEIRYFGFLEGVLIVLFVFISFSIGVLRWKEILKGMDISASFSKLFSANIAAYGIVYLIPIGVFWADVLKAKAVNHKDNSFFSRAMASVFLDRIFNTLINLLLVMVGLFFFFKTAGFLWMELGHVYLTALLFFFLTLFFIVFFIMFPGFFETAGFLSFFFNSFSNRKKMIEDVKKEIFSFYRRSRVSFQLRILFLSVLHGASLLFLSFLIIYSLGYKLSLFSTWALFGPTFASLETPISADLGSHDLTSAFVCEALGMRRSTGVVYALVFRGANLVLTGVGLFFLARIGLRSLRDHLLKRLEKAISFHE